MINNLKHRNRLTEPTKLGRPYLLAELLKSDSSFNWTTIITNHINLEIHNLLVARIWKKSNLIFTAKARGGENKVVFLVVCSIKSNH